MQSSRKSFIDILREDFCDNEVKQKCIQSSMNYLKHNYVSRVFDDFPGVMPQDELAPITEIFTAIFKNIEVNEANGYQLNDEFKQRALYIWETKIAKIACGELFDDNGKIKTELVTLLGWNDYANKINHCELVCAFVATVNRMIWVDLYDLINQDTLKITAVSSYVNANYRNWVRSVMQGLHLPVDAEYDEAKATNRKGLPEVLMNSRNHALEIGVSVGVGAGVLAAVLAVGGFLLFSSQKSGGSLDLADTPSPGLR